MNVTFHVVGNTAAEVREATRLEIERFFGGWDEEVVVEIDASGRELDTSSMDGPSLIRSGYYATVNVRSADGRS